MTLARPHSRTNRTRAARLAPSLAPSLALVGLALLAACSGASGPGASATFEVTGISVLPGVPHRLNRPVDVSFSSDVDFSTVSANTIQIRAIGTSQAVQGAGSNAAGQPSVGTFSLVAADTVRFTPACPTTADYSDGGFVPRMQYTIRVRGKNAAGPTVRSTTGDRVERTASAAFATPQSNDPSDLFLDLVPGPPAFVFRPQGSSEQSATYLELGLDDANRVYFEQIPAGGVELPLGFLAPINPYSVIAERVAWLVRLDQPVDPDPANFGPERVALEGLDGNGAWVRLATDVEVLSNCTEEGALLRLTPRGVLPQDAEVRALLGVGFSDIAGEALPADLAAAVAPIATSFDPGTTTAGDDGDQRFTAFVLSGDLPGSLEDTDALFAVQSADWGNGELVAAPVFQGTGGPGGDFDWHIPPGTTVILDTVFDTIVGGPDGVPVNTQTVINGVVDIRDLFIPASSRLIAIGPNPVTILASGDVLIEGGISVNGGDSPGVGTLNTTNIPEPGAPGNAGGGRGGTGSYLTTESTPRGGHGFGPFDVPDGGGRGGETSYSNLGKNQRRGAGGGGGGYATDVRYDHDDNGQDFLRCQTLTGMDVERGALGGLGGLGAISQSQRAQGGEPGPSPFVDGTSANDFRGVLTDFAGRFIVGEIDAALPGAGGGAGGDAVNSDSFPLVPFSNQGDEKGAGGGGGGGVVHILAVNQIVVTETGSISANGGDGNGGENTNFFDRVGGGSGGGSAGAVVLESLAFIEVRGTAADAGDFYRDNELHAIHGSRALSALGGQGGAGNQSRGGANENGPTQWRCDRIPFDHFEGFTDVPPLQSVCFQSQPDFFDPEGGPTVGAGGDGAPGLIQLHVPDPQQNLRFPDAGGDLTKVATPPPVGWNIETGDYDGYLVPSFGPRSAAQSKWIALGLARQDPSGVDEQVELFFGGVSAQGSVLTTGTGEVQLEAPLIGPDLVQSAPATPYVTADPFTMVFDSSGVSGFDDVVERNPALLRAYSLRLSLASQPDVQEDYVVIDAGYDSALDELIVTVSADGGPLTDFNPGSDVQAELVPRSFLVATDDAPDKLSTNAAVRIVWDATIADPLGQPDESQSYSSVQGDFAGDIGLLNQADWDFVRFKVEFDQNASGQGIDTRIPELSLRHLRVPFRF